VSTRVVETRSEAATQELARAMAARLKPGSVLLLRGELGAGKTAFVRGLAEGLEVPDDQVSSPTFTLVQSYRGRLPLLHADLYRITSVEVDDLGLHESAEEGVLVIEWAEKLSRPVPGAISILLEDLGGDRRRITING
jgi:tRNA threonylcarbamoyladenosine biosynthesis protein TsaE